MRIYKRSIEPDKNVTEDGYFEVEGKLAGLSPQSYYRDGGEGFAKWCEDFVYIQIYLEGTDAPVWVSVKDLPSTPNPDTGRSWKSLWEEQKKLMKEALRIEGGRFVHRLIVLCWPRGEGKSVMACLIQMWKFFCWPRQHIVLGANSKDQVKFVHFDIIKDIILNSPKLKAIVGDNNIQQKVIQLTHEGNVVSTIRAISSFSGIVSNIAGYTFSEMFDMKNPKFFVQLDGSIRNIPQALGVIDSTVSAKDHVLYKLYLDKQKKAKGSESVFYSYRCSETGDYKDYWHPLNNQTQLESYRSKFPMGEFERYFQNLWSAGKVRVLTDALVDSIGYIGLAGSVGSAEKVIELLEKKHKILTSVEWFDKEKNMDVMVDNASTLEMIEKSLNPISPKYLCNSDHFGNYKMGSSGNVFDLTHLYDTDWGVLVGIDRGDPMSTRFASRTIVTALLKGYPRSRSSSIIIEEQFPQYVYIVLHVGLVLDHSLEGIKEHIRMLDEEFDGVDTICGERWGLWDLSPWCEEKNISLEVLFPTYDRQRSAFGELYDSVKKGRFKAAPIPIPGSKEPDILREEMKLFDHDVNEKWFGSPEKGEKYGIQDDVMYSVGWAMYGGRVLGIDKFRPRGQGMVGRFGLFERGQKLVGNY